MNKQRMNRLVNMIRGLTVVELGELNKKLREMGLPPMEHSNVPAKPKSGPPSLTGAAHAEKGVNEREYGSANSL